MQGGLGAAKDCQQFPGRQLACERFLHLGALQGPAQMCQQAQVLAGVGRIVERRLAEHQAE